jgi:dihydrodipicolinate synthase/N-acetylneuraminate lyase
MMMHTAGTSATSSLAKGIVSVLQMPFDEAGQLVPDDIRRLVDYAIDSGVNGLLVPVVASEVSLLTEEERELIVRLTIEQTDSRVPVIVGASSENPAVCRRMRDLAGDAGATAWLAAVPGSLYGDDRAILQFFREIALESSLPLVIQDLQFDGPGLSIPMIRNLREVIPSLGGLKIETVPAGSKYTAVRDEFGDEFYIAGGWAVPQMIEALDRGVDAMIPESSMVPVYSRIDQTYRSGNRAAALNIFHQLLPVLAFTNQEIKTSVAFFKRLLVRKRIFRSSAMRWQGLDADRFTERIMDELIDHYLALESALHRSSI